MRNIERIAHEAKETLDTASPEALLAWAAETFSPRVALSCSFGGPGGVVLAHMAHRLGLSIPLLFIDTGFLFPETYRLKEEVRRAWRPAIVTITPALTPEEQAERYGDELWGRDPDLCCALRKVAPMARALEELDCWITALRRDQSPTRAQVDPIELHRLETGRAILKLNPLARWTKREVWQYVTTYGLPYNRLLDEGYRSIGCVQCTAKASGDDERAGRWQGTTKTECGLHTFTQRTPGRGSGDTVE